MGGRVGNLWQVVSALVYVTLQITISYTSDYGGDDIMVSKNVFIALYEIWDMYVCCTICVTLEHKSILDWMILIAIIYYYNIKFSY